MAKKPQTPEAGSNSNKRLKSFVERISNLLDEKDVLTKDVSDVVKEAKNEGWNTKTLRRAVRESRRDPEKRHEEESELDLYLHAIGLI